MNPYANAIWEYNFGVAEELVKMGFGEIQFDYIRFPEPYKSLPPQVFPESNGRGKTRRARGVPQGGEDAHRQARRAHDGGHLRARDDGGRRARGRTEVGADSSSSGRRAADGVSVALSARLVRASRVPNAEPYEVMHTAISRARERDRSWASRAEHVRPWLQAFTLGQPQYGPAEIEAQKKAVYDSGYDGWVLWNPGSIVRRVPSRAREDAGVASEEPTGSAQVHEVQLISGAAEQAPVQPLPAVEARNEEPLLRAGPGPRYLARARS